MTGQVSLYEFRGIRLSFAVQGGAKGDEMNIMHEYALYSRGICIIMHVHVLNCHENCGRLYSTERGSEIYAPKGGGVEGSPIRYYHIHNHLYLSKTSFPKVFTFVLRHF